MNTHARRTDTVRSWSIIVWEFNAPPDTIYTGHFAGDLHSQLLDWYKQKTKQFKTINNFSSTNQWSSSLMRDNITATECRDSVIRQWRTRHICIHNTVAFKDKLGRMFWAQCHYMCSVLKQSRFFRMFTIWRHNYVISRNGHSIFTCPMTHIPLVYSLKILCKSTQISMQDIEENVNGCFLWTFDSVQVYLETWSWSGLHQSFWTTCRQETRRHHRNGIPMA